MFFDKPENAIKASDTFALGEPSTFAERTAATYNQSLVQSNALARYNAWTEAYDTRIKEIKDAVGEDLSDIHPMKRRDTGTSYSEGMSVDQMNPITAEDPHVVFGKRLKELQDKHPDKAGFIKAEKPVNAKDAYWERSNKADDASRNYGGPWGTGVIGDLMGGLGAQAADPINLPTIALGPMGQVGRGAKAIALMGAKQAAANAGVEAVFQPFIQDWRKQMGDAYGISHAALDIGMAGAFGFAADAGIRTAYRGTQKALGRTPVLDPKTGAVTGYESKAAATERGVATDIAQAVDAGVASKEAQAKALLDALEKNNIPEARARAQDLGLTDDPAFRGALNELELSPIEGLDSGADERAMIQALRAYGDPSEPFPAHVDGKPQAKTPDLSSHAEVPKGIDGNQHYRNFEIDGKPVSFRAIDVKAVESDPAQFQFKGGRDEKGASGNLKAALTWEENAAGKLMLYERADGVLMVVDGHDRVALAKRLTDQETKGQGYVFRAEDGWKPEDVRALAAQKNLEEGTGSIFDAARAIKDRPDIVSDRMPLETDFMRLARSLSRLSDEALARVADGEIDPKYGALIGEHVADTTKHNTVLDDLVKRDPKSERDARLAIQKSIAEPQTAEAIATVLGGSIVPPHLVSSRGEVLGGVMDALMNRDLDGLVLSDVIGRLAERRGYVSDLLNQAAKVVSEGQPKQRAVDAFLRQIAAKMEEGGVKGLDTSPALLAALSGSDAAVGKSMRRQLDQLGYYSKALEAAQSWPQGKGTPEQALMWLKKSGVKDAEIEATGLKSALEGRPSITRDEVIKHLEENRVGLKEATYNSPNAPEWGQSNPPPPNSEAARISSQFGNDGMRFSNANGDDITDVARGLAGRPRHENGMDVYTFRDGSKLLVADGGWDVAGGVTRGKWSSYSLDSSNPTYRETVLHLPWSQNEFRSGHLSEPNIIGHMMTSMTKHEGKPVFTLDQIQSDWGQKLRDGGVRDEAKIAGLEQKIKETSDAAKRTYDEIKANNAQTPDSNSWDWSAFNKLKEDGERLGAELRTAKASAPGHPLVNTTDQWTIATLRRAMRQAAEADAAYIAIPHGDTVLSYNPGDADGMRGFYGSRTSEGIVPKNLRKILEKIDKDASKPIRVEKVEASDGLRGWKTDSTLKFDKEQTGFTLFPLTQKVKQSVKDEGQPLFSQPANPKQLAQDVEAFAVHLESVLKDAQKETPPRLVDNAMKDDAHTAVLFERYQGEDPSRIIKDNAALAFDIVSYIKQAAPAQLASFAREPDGSIPRSMSWLGLEAGEPIALNAAEIAAKRVAQSETRKVTPLLQTAEGVQEAVRSVLATADFAFRHSTDRNVWNVAAMAPDGSMYIVALKPEGYGQRVVTVLDLEPSGTRKKLMAALAPDYDLQDIRWKSSPEAIDKLLSIVNRMHFVENGKASPDPKLDELIGMLGQEKQRLSTPPTELLQTTDHDAIGAAIERLSKGSGFIADEIAQVQKKMAEGISREEALAPFLKAIEHRIKEIDHIDGMRLNEKVDVEELIALANDGHSHTSIAMETGTPPETVKTYVADLRRAGMIASVSDIKAKGIVKKKATGEDAKILAERFQIRRERQQIKSDGKIIAANQDDLDVLRGIDGAPDSEHITRLKEIGRRFMEGETLSSIWAEMNPSGAAGAHLVDQLLKHGIVDVRKIKAERRAAREEAIRQALLQDSTSLSEVMRKTQASRSHVKSIRAAAGIEAPTPHAMHPSDVKSAVKDMLKEGFSYSEIYGALPDQFSSRSAVAGLVFRMKRDGDILAALARSDDQTAAVEAKGTSGPGQADASLRHMDARQGDPALAAQSLTDLYLKQMDAQRSGFADAIEQATSAIESVYPGMTTRTSSALDAAPDLKARISELMGNDPQAAKALIAEALPAPTRPDIPQAVDTSRPLLYSQAANTRMAEIRAEIDRTIQMLPPDVRLRVEDNLVFNFDGTDARLDGLWDGYDRIVYASLAAGDPVRAVRHEVIHALRQSKLMTDDEFKTLYAFAEKAKLREAYAIDAVYLAKYTAAYGHRGADYVEMLMREETIANMFSDYSLNGRRFGDVAGGSWADQIIDKVVSFMKAVRDSLNVLGFREVQDIFEDIESGRMAQRGADGIQQDLQSPAVGGMLDETPVLTELREMSDLVGICKS